MLRYYKGIWRNNGSTEEKEVSYETAYYTLLGTWKDTDITRDMLTIQNYIECDYSYIRVDDPDSELKPMPGLRNLTPEGVVYDDAGKRVEQTGGTTPVG